MALPRSSLLHLGVFLVFVPIWTALSQSPLKQTLCSSINTSSMNANISFWQSNGLCKDFCNERNAAFAVVQWQSCWCSDVAPAESTTAGVDDKCIGICPGFGDLERCGMEPEWFGYIALMKPPTSTAGDSPGHPPPKPTPKPNESLPPTAVQTVTADGTVRTVTVTPTANQPGAAELNPQRDGSGGTNTGQIVGIVVGVIAAVIIAAALGLWCFFTRRRRARDNENLDTPSHRGSPSGMMGGSRNPEMVVTAGSDGRDWEPETAAEQRRSRLMAVDPRMDPFTRAAYLRNKSHESINTLRDDQDYSRKVHHPPVLRAVNPDPLDD